MALVHAVAQKANFYMVWGDDLKALFAHQAMEDGLCELPEAFKHLSEVSQQLSRHVVHGKASSWAQVEMFLADLQTETCTAFNKPRKHVYTTHCTMDYHCKFHGNPRFKQETDQERALPSSQAHKRRATSTKVNCTAKIQVTVPLHIAIQSGVVTQLEASRAPAATSAPAALGECVLLTAHLDHKGHTPMDPADLMNLPPDPR
jgi:hypothetical protein